MTTVMTRVEPDPFGDLNNDRSRHGMGVLSVASQIELMARSIHPSQQLREFIHNSIHAISRLGAPGEVRITRVMRNGVAKLAIVDDGCGMSPLELRDLLGQLCASAGGVNGSRFGVGSKITGLYRNPCGLEYTTYNGVDAPVTATLALDADFDEYGWKGPSPFRRPESLPAMIESAGHGTQVVLLGATPAEDTFELACGLPAGNKRFARYINSRYDGLPEHITISVAAKRSKRRNEIEHRSSDVRGAAAALADVAEQRGVVRVDGAAIRWYHSDSASSASTSWRHNDNCMLHGFVGVAVRDAEVDGLSELYETYTGVRAASLFGTFGLSQLVSNIAVIIEPDDVVVVGTRDGVCAPDGDPLPLDRWASEFKANMPTELAELVEAACAGSDVGDDNRLIEKLRKNILLLSNKAFRRGDGTGSSNGPGGTGSDGTHPGTRPGTGDGPSKSPSTRGGAGNGPGGTAHSTGDGVTAGGTHAGFQVPETIPFSGDEVPEELVDRFAQYQPSTNELWVNVDFPGIDTELAQYLHGKRNVTRTDREIARKIVVDAMVDRVREAIIRTAALSEVSPHWRGEYDIAFAHNSWALTMAAMTCLTGSSETARHITRAIG